MTRAARIGLLHLRLEAATAGVLHHRVALRAQRLGKQQRRHVGALALQNHIGIGRRHVHRPAALAQERNQALDAGGEADARRGLAAQLREQAVVAPAAAYRTLRAEALGFPGPDVDAELIVMCAALWKELGLEGIRLELNSIGEPDERARYRADLIAHLQKHEGSLDADAKRLTAVIQKIGKVE